LLKEQTVLYGLGDTMLKVNWVTELQSQNALQSLWLVVLQIGVVFLLAVLSVLESEPMERYGLGETTKDVNLELAITHVFRLQFQS
jgi:hypothetical protein